MKKATIFAVYSPYTGENVYCASLTGEQDGTPYEVEIPDDFKPHFTLPKVFYDSRNDFWELDGKTTWAYKGSGEGRKLHTYQKVWVRNWETGETIALIDTDTTN